MKLSGNIHQGTKKDLGGGGAGLSDLFDLVFDKLANKYSWDYTIL